MTRRPVTLQLDLAVLDVGLVLGGQQPDLLGLVDR